MVVVRSVRVVISMEEGREALSWGSRRLMRSTTAMMLAPGWRWMFTMTAGLLVHPRRELDVLHAVDDVGHVGQPHRRAVLVGDDDLLVLVARQELVVGPDGERLPRPLQIALGLVDVGLAEDGAQVFETQPVGGERGGIGLHADGGTLTAADRDESHAGELGDLLGEVGVGEVFHAAQGQGVRGEGEGEDGRVRGIDLAVDGRIGQIARAGRSTRH